MIELNLCNEVLENAIGVHRSLEKIEPLNPMDAVAVQAMEDLLQYRAIGTIDECRTAVERMKPKNPIIKNWCPAICPTCKRELSESLGDGYYKHYESMKYCECGQALDWQ